MFKIFVKKTKKTENEKLTTKTYLFDYVLELQAGLHIIIYSAHIYSLFL